MQALCAAARDGVDVRLLVPGASDIPALPPLSRAGYRPLLAAGVRVFEWNGTMLHAKTAVADGLWARVGSTNLNFASWIHNYELDVAIEDRGFAEQMAAMYEQDLAHATEIVLTRRNRVRQTEDGAASRGRARTRRAARAGRRRAPSVGNALGAALTNRRLLGRPNRDCCQAGVVTLGFAIVAALLAARRGIPLAMHSARGSASHGWARRGRCGGSAESRARSLRSPEPWTRRPSGGAAVGWYNCRFAPVAQLDRVPGYEPGGRGFDSCRARQ